MTPEKMQSQKEKVARLSARNLRQLATFLRDTAKEAAKPMYADRVLSPNFSAAMDELNKAIWKVSDLIVPRNPKTGFADAGKLIQAVVAHAFRPQEAATKKGTVANRKSATGQKKASS